jgi:hypothetical protein
MVVPKCTQRRASLVSPSCMYTMAATSCKVEVEPD